MANKLLSIIVLNYNRLHYTRQTIERLIEATTVRHEFLWVDNGSTKDGGVVKYLNKMSGKTNAERVRIILNGENLGVAAGRNEGLHVASGDYLMCIDDDILVPDNYDLMLTEACDKIENLGITGISTEKRKFSVKEYNGVKMQYKNGNLGGGCLCMSRAAFEKLGYFSVFGVYGLEDCDMYNRVKRARMLSLYVEKNGKHIDVRDNKIYEAIKKKAHKFGSKQFNQMAAKDIYYKRSGRLYVYYERPKKLNSKHIDSAIKRGIKK